MGLPNRIFPGITIGNCSMASGVRDAGSLPRMFYTIPQGMRLLFAQYLSNNLYVYPEHRDHDPGTNGSPGYGDVYPANTPYLLISQGSSYSDRPFVQALLKTLGAFRPEVRRRLKERRVIAPTLQQILRSHYGPTGSPFPYLSGQSHPTVFNGELLDEMAMVRAAHDLRLDTLPPLIHLAVIREDTPTHGIDFFEPENLRSERLFDTNSAIARVYRSRQPTRSITVSARQSIDINNRPLAYRWVLLRGDPNLVRITPAEDGGQAEILIAHHPRRPIHEGSSISSSRVDIGVFAHNGIHYSAPGFVTLFTLDNEQRIYDGDGRLLEIYYGARTTEYSLKPISPEQWMATLKKLQQGPDSHDLSRLLRTTIDPKQVESLASIYRAADPIHAELITVRDRARSRAFELENQLKTAQAKLETVAQAAQGKPQLLARAKADLETAQAARSAAQPELEILRNEVRELSDSITTRLEEHGPEKQAATDLIGKVIEAVIHKPKFCIDHQQEIQQLQHNPGHQGEAFGRTLRELVACNVLTEDKGTYRLTCDTKPIRPNDYHHLRRLNLVLATDVLFPDIVDRSTERNFVDPRLTSNKRWRDIYHHGADGEITGWHRVENGKITAFDARGRILPSSPGGSPREVDYRIDPQSKQLATIPIGANN